MTRIFVIAVVLALVPMRAGAETVATLKVLFKFDPGPTYGGATWREPPYATGLQGGASVKVEAKVVASDARGKAVVVAPRWTAADPAMVTVTPVVAGQLCHVSIAVRRAGETRLKVAADGVETELRIKAKVVIRGAMRVEISR